MVIANGLKIMGHTLIEVKVILAKIDVALQVRFIKTNPQPNIKLKGSTHALATPVSRIYPQKLGRWGRKRTETHYAVRRIKCQTANED
jgi:hypothetical protein